MTLQTSACFYLFIYFCSHKWIYFQNGEQVFNKICPPYVPLDYHRATMLVYENLL